MCIVAALVFVSSHTWNSEIKQNQRILLISELWNFGVPWLLLRSSDKLCYGS